jgi:hypothetical protein
MQGMQKDMEWLQILMKCASRFQWTGSITAESNWRTLRSAVSVRQGQRRAKAWIHAQEQVWAQVRK